MVLNNKETTQQLILKCPLLNFWNLWRQLHLITTICWVEHTRKLLILVTMLLLWFWQKFYLAFTITLLGKSGMQPRYEFRHKHICIHTCLWRHYMCMSFIYLPVYVHLFIWPNRTKAFLCVCAHVCTERETHTNTTYCIEYK